MREKVKGRGESRGTYASRIIIIYNRILDMLKRRGTILAFLSLLHPTPHHSPAPYYIHIVRLCNTLAPISSYSSFVTHIDLNAAKLANILPPIQVKNCLFGGALILILTS